MNKELVSRVLSGDKAAEAEFILYCMKYMRLVVTKITKGSIPVEDIIQDAIIAALRGLPSLKEPKYAKSWIYRIAANESKNALRRRSAAGYSDSEHCIDPKPTREHEMICREFYEKAIYFVFELPHRQSQVLSMILFDQIKMTEVAKQLDIPYDTAKANYRHGILKLRTYLASLGCPDSFSATERQGEIVNL